MLDSGAEGTGFKLQSRRCRVTVLGKLLTHIVPLFAKRQNCSELRKKTDEPIEMRFGLWTHVGLRNHVLRQDSDTPEEWAICGLFLPQ